jgi:hypothetical protein
MYSAKQLKTGRLVVLISWIFAVLSFLPPLAASPIGPLGRALFGILFCVHLVEFAFFRKIYAAAGGSMFSHFLRHMTYGVLYKTEVEQESAAR